MAHLDHLPKPTMTFEPELECVGPPNCQTFIVRSNGTPTARLYFGPHGNLYMRELFRAGNMRDVCDTQHMYS